MGIYAAGINVGVLLAFWSAAGSMNGMGGAWLFRCRSAWHPTRSFNVLYSARTDPLQAPKPMPKNIFTEVWETFKIMMAIPSLAISSSVPSGGVCGLRRAVLERGLFPPHSRPLSWRNGTVLALIGGIIGGIGTLSGGWLADRLAQHDKRYYVWLTAG